MVGAEVGDHLKVHRRDPAISLGADADPVGLVPAVVGGGQVLTPALDPLDSPAESPGTPGDDRFLRVDIRLAPEATADVGGADMKPPGVDPELPRDVGPDQMRVLGGRPEVDPPAVRFGDHPACLHRNSGDPVVANRSLEHQVGLLEARLEIAALQRPFKALVGPEVGVDQRRALLQSHERVNHDRARFVLDGYVLDHMLDGVAVAADDDSDRDSDTGDPITGKRPPLRLEYFGVRWFPDHRLGLSQV